MSASAIVNATAIVLSAAVTDNVGVTQVQFLIDGNAVTGTVETSPSKELFTLSLPTNLFASGEHRLVARAWDDAGNSTDSAAINFTVGSPAPAPGVPPLTVSASSSGNFGLIKLAAVASANVPNGVYSVRFFVDGQDVGRADPDLESTSANHYALLFDATGLGGGRHRLVARAIDKQNNFLDSAEVFFDVDIAAGVVEAEPNNSVATATAVPTEIRQISGHLGEGRNSDYFRLTVLAGRTLRIDMLTPGYQFLFMHFLDAEGKDIGSDMSKFKTTNTIIYTQGALDGDVYVWVTSGLDAPGNDGKYNLMLSYP